MTIVDTSVLSLAFRRRAHQFPEPEEVRKLRELITDNRPVSVPGIVLQELLSGVRTSAEFERLQEVLEGFPVMLVSQDHHVIAARITNACIQAGVFVSTVDCLIAAMTVQSDERLLTTDRDFVLMAPHCGLKLLV